MLQILVADDDSMTRLALTKNLERWGYEVITAENGTQAYEELTKENPPRLALLDWLMPGMEGVEICRKVSNRTDIPQIYTILLTIKKDKKDIIKALDYGASDFLSKPVHVGELRSRLAVGARLVEAEDKLRDYAFKMERLAVIDPLTGAYNRRHFFEVAEKEFCRSHRYNNPLSFILFDIDHFKKINDTYGHQTGDKVLKVLVEVCTDSLRASDTFARYGGEEFCIMLPETSMDQAHSQAERIRKALAGIPFKHKDESFSFTVSLGVSSLKETDSKIDDIVARADTALYEAKNQGRNQTRVV